MLQLGVKVAYSTALCAQVQLPDQYSEEREPHLDRNKVRAAWRRPNALLYSVLLYAFLSVSRPWQQCIP